MRVGHESFPPGNGLLSVATNLCECVCMHVCVFQFLWVTGDSCESSTRPGLARHPIIDLYTRILINVAYFSCLSPSLSLPLCILVCFYLFISLFLALSPNSQLNYASCFDAVFLPSSSSSLSSCANWFCHANETKSYFSPVLTKPMPQTIARNLLYPLLPLFLSLTFANSLRKP